MYSASCSVYIGSFELRSLDCPWCEVCIFFFNFAESILCGSIMLCNVLWIKWFQSNICWGLRKIWTVCFYDCFRACHALFFLFLQTCWGLWIIVWIHAFLFLLVSLGSLNFPVVKKIWTVWLSVCFSASHICSVFLFLLILVRVYV